MMHDIFGCDIEIAGTDPKASVESWNDLCHGFLSHGASTAGHLGDLLKNDPDCVLGYACKGFFMILLGRSELFATVDECLAKITEIERRRDKFARRETDYVAALRYARLGQWSRAANLLESIFDYAPHDAMAFKLVQALRFMLGDRFGMRASSLRAVERFGKDHFATGYVYGCHAFALEETGDFRAAEKFGKEGVLMTPDDAWGLHAVAHVYDMTAQAELGIQWLEARANQWSHCNNFAYHFWWHLALHYLETGNFVRVLELYDNDIRKDCSDDYRDISNATSLLVRLEGMGVDVGNRWDELVALSQSRAGENCVVFGDLHYMHALGRANDLKAMDKLIEALRANASVGMRDLDEVNRHAGIPAAEGIKAFYQGDFVTAFERLAMARPAMQQIGGSHAQRDVFERMTIDAGLKAGKYSEAKSLIEDRTWRRSVEDSFARDRMKTALIGEDQMMSTHSHSVETPISLVSA